MTKRVVITGMGVISPLGSGLETFWSALMRGESGIRRIQRFDASEFRSQIAGEVPDFDPSCFIDRKEARRMDRFTQMAIGAAAMALQDADLDPSVEDREQVGVILGSGIGGIKTLEDQARVMVERGPGRVSPFFVPMMIGNMAAAQIAIAHGFAGPNMTLVAACASSNNAIGEAMRAIKYGDAEVVLTGGSEASVSPLALAGFCAMKALSMRNEDPSRASRPFDGARDGFIMSEGAAVLILESEEHARRRGARVYAELAGYGLSCDAYHITAIEPEGRGAALAMRRAMQDAGVTPGDIDYINAHGTSTRLGDIGETAGIKKAFGRKAYDLAVSSTKSMTGHLLGAAGAVEAVACALTIKRGIIPPTVNYETPDPECDLDYVPNTARKADVRVALSNGFGFGGHNATLCLKRFADGEEREG